MDEQHAILESQIRPEMQRLTRKNTQSVAIELKLPSPLDCGVLLNSLKHPNNNG